MAAAFFLPELVSFIQLPVYKQNHLDGMRRITVTDDAIKIQPDKYAEKEYDFSLITKIIDRGTYYKLMIGNRPLYLHKEDFVKGNPDYFFEYVKCEIKE